MKMRHAMLALISAGSVSACATTTGNGEMNLLTQRSADKLLVTGKTTRAEVIGKLGACLSFRFDSGYEVCVYEFQHGIPRYVDYVPIAGLFSSHTRRTDKEVRILFDPAGIVQKYLVLDIVKPDEAQMPAD
jgi:hypothetical protein